MSVKVTYAEFSDFEALRYAVQDAPLDIVQIENGPMSGALAHFAVGTIGISTGRYTRGIRACGMLSQRRWAFCSIIGSDSVRVDKLEAKPGDQIVIQPGREIYSANEHANHYATALIRPHELFSFVEGQQPGAADAAVWREVSSVSAIDPQYAAARVEKFRTLLAALQAHGPTMSAETIDFYRRGILEFVTGPLLDGHRDGGYVRLRKSAACMVREIDRYLVDAGRPVHVSELCEKFKVSRRTLHRAFHDVVGIPPITFLRNKRLGDVHSRLLRGGPDLVRDIAIAHGFLEYGRFAGEYQRLFGEKPTRTLRRGRRFPAH